MNIYIEYKNYSFFKKAYEYVVGNSEKEVNKAYIINYKGGFVKKPRIYLKRNGIYDVEYVIYGVKGLNRAIKYLNYNKNPINLTLIIDKEISERAKKIILKAQKTIKIIDFSNNLENIEFYKSFNKIIYKTNDEDVILSVDLMHVYKFFEPIFQCKFSSCLGKNYYVDKKGIISFCPNHLSESMIGDIKSNEKFKDNKLFSSVLNKAIEKRDNCKENCKYYEYCVGGCPLEDGCCNFPEMFEKSSTYVDNIINNNKDLAQENYAIAKIIIKDSVYSEETT